MLGADVGKEVRQTHQGADGYMFERYSARETAARGRGMALFHTSNQVCTSALSRICLHATFRDSASLSDTEPNILPP